MTDRLARVQRQPHGVVDEPPRPLDLEPDAWEGAYDCLFVVLDREDVGTLTRAAPDRLRVAHSKERTLERSVMDADRVVVVTPRYGPGRQEAIELADRLASHAKEISTWTVPELGLETAPDLKTIDKTWGPSGKDGLSTLLVNERPWEKKTDAPAISNGLHPSTNGNGKRPSEIDVLDDVTDPVKDVDPAAFHGLLGKLVHATQPETEANPLFVLLHLLTFFGVAVGRKPHFITGGTHHYLSMYVAIIGPTGLGRKGSAGDVAREIWRKVDPEFTNDKIRGGLNTGAGLLYHLRDASEKRGKNGTSEVDEGVEDKRHVFLETELSSVLIQAKTESNPILCQLRDFWDGRPTIGSYTREPIKVTGGHIGIVGHCTAVDLATHLEKAQKANGTANRFLWHYGGRSKELPEGGNVFTLLDNVLAPELGRLREAISFAETIGEVRRHASLKERWASIYHDFASPPPGTIGAFFARAPVIVMRIAMIFALIDFKREIREAHLNAALAIWDHAERSLRYIFRADLDPMAEKMLAAITASQHGLTTTEIRDLFDRHAKAQDIKERLENLLAERVIERVDSKPTGGRPSIRYRRKAR